MIRKSRWAVATVCVSTLVVTACSDDRSSIIDPGDPSGVPGVSAIVVDAARGTGGAPGFYLLPPVVSNPNPTGEFNPGLFPNVVACRFASATPNLSSAPTTPAGADFSSCTPITPVTVEVDHYQAKWNTDKDQVAVFRVFVTFGTQIPVTLGFVDVNLVSGGGAKAASGSDIEAEVTSAGRTIPINFRIEEEANEVLVSSFPSVLIPGGVGNTCDPADDNECGVFSVPPGGGTFVLDNPFNPLADGGIAGIEFPAGWSPGGIARNLLISCNNGEFCVSGQCTDVTSQTYAPGDGPLGSEADPSVAAERPLYCEYKLDPPLEEGETFTSPATIGFCGVDDLAHPQLEPLHPHNPKGGPLVEVGRNEGTLAVPIFDRTGTTTDPFFAKAAEPDFLDCDGVAVNLLATGPSSLGPIGPALEWFAGRLAPLFGGWLAPEPLYASRYTLVRDGGVGATLGSLKTIFGLVELGQGSIQGSVLDPSGLPFAGVPVELSNAVSASTTTGVDGTFGFPSLTGAAFTVSLDLDSYDGPQLYCLSTSEGVSLDAEAGQIVTVDFVCDEVQTVVFDEGAENFGVLDLGTGGPPAGWEMASFLPQGSGGALGAGPFASATFAAENSGGGFNCSVSPSTLNGSYTGWPRADDAGGPTQIVVQKRFLLPPNANALRVHVGIDNDVRVVVNGTEITSTAALVTSGGFAGIHTSRTHAIGGHNTNGVQAGTGFLLHEGCPTLNDIVLDATAQLIPGGENVVTVLARDRGGLNFLGVKVTVDLGCVGIC